MPLWVVPIVEGHGEVRAIRPLLQRIGFELGHGRVVQVLQAFRVHRSKVFRQPEELLRIIDLAQEKLRFAAPRGEPGFILVLLDSDPDEEPPCVLGPRLQEMISSERAHLDAATVFAHREWETWFVAAAASLKEYLELPSELPVDPEAAGCKKAWVAKHIRGPGYSETADQAKLSAAMDLALCRDRSPSFDKLCRAVLRRLEGPTPAETEPR